MFNQTPITMKKFTILLYSILLAAGVFAADVVISDDGSGTGTSTWTSDNTYILDGFVFVNDGQTLTIEAGTVIKGKPGQQENASALIVAMGGKLIANGTADAPIIFTSENDNLAGSLPDEANGLWGGVIMLGKAKTNNATVPKQIEGIPTTEARAQYGGDDNFDGSGQLSYVSIRHGGTDIGEGNEINGLTLGACGSATTFSYIEVVSNKDDGVEFFGGVPRLDHILVAWVGDDSYDYDEGFSGYGQFWATVQVAADGDRLGEHDGGPSDCEFCEPYAMPVIHNATYIGVPGQSRRTITFRDKAGGIYLNSIFAEQDKGIDIEYIEGEDEGSYQQWKNGNLIISNNIFQNIADGSAAKLFTVSVPVDENENPKWEVPAGYAEAFADYFATANNTVADAGVSATDPVPSNDVSGTDYTGVPLWFKRVDFKGAFRPGTMWAGSWTLAYADMEFISDDETVSVRDEREYYKAANVYPNPITSTATVSFKYDSGIYNFTVYNLAGSRVKEVWNITNGEFTFDRENLEAGIYFYQLRNERGSSLSGKFMIHQYAHNKTRSFLHGIIHSLVLLRSGSWWWAIYLSDR